jgi:hypothetical protein
MFIIVQHNNENEHVFFYLNGAVNVNNNCIFRIKLFAVYMLLHVREIYLM